MTTPSFRHDRPGTPAHRWTDALTRHAPPALQLPESARRLVVLGAHPDDETLGAGGLVRLAARDGMEAHVLSVTAGEGSHPGSPTHTPGQLRELRTGELHEAVRRLAPDAAVTCLGLPDGAVRDHVEDVVAHMVELIGTAGDEVVVAAPWRRDGHPDHEAAGLAAAVAARRTDARLLEYPVWLWHWGREDDLPWEQVHTLALDEAAMAAKRAAISEHASQVAPLSGEPGDEVLLDEHVLAHFTRDVEVYVVDGVPVEDDALEQVHRERPDPWQSESHYERRKRALTLASLPREQYGTALEVGCSTGALAVDLAERCGHLLAVDSSPTAVEAARARTQALSHVDVRQASVPDGWPTGSFDLVSVSEVGYFLSPQELRAVVARTFDTLGEDGHVLLCHWRHQPVGWPLAGPAVHEAFLATSAPVLVEHHEPDFLLHVLGRPS